MNRKLKNFELNRLSPDMFKQSEKFPFIVLLDNVRSLHNIGSIFRSADAFLIESVYLTGCSAKPPHRDINKTALGATETVKWVYRESVQDAIKELKKEGCIIVAVEQTEQSVSLFDFKMENGKRYVLVFGHEVNGVEQHVINEADLCIDIPQFGTKHSLNISVCAGIVLCEFVNKFKCIK